MDFAVPVSGETSGSATEHEAAATEVVASTDRRQLEASITAPLTNRHLIRDHGPRRFRVR